MNLKIGISAIKELEERTGSINKKCNEILSIVSDPIKMLTGSDKINELICGIQLDMLILNNFMEAINKANEVNRKESEENGTSKKM